PPDSPRIEGKGCRSPNGLRPDEVVGALNNLNAVKSRLKLKAVVFRTASELSIEQIHSTVLIYGGWRSESVKRVAEAMKNDEWVCDEITVKEVRRIAKWGAKDEQGFWHQGQVTVAIFDTAVTNLNTAAIYVRSSGESDRTEYVEKNAILQNAL